MTTSVYRIAYGLAVVLNLGLGAFLTLLATGAVPVPQGWAWATPVVIAAVTGACALLPRLGSEHLSSQVDLLASKGIQKRDMVVMTQDEAVQAMTSDGAPFTALQLQQVADELQRRMQATPADTTTTTTTTREV